MRLEYPLGGSGTGVLKPKKTFYASDYGTFQAAIDAAKGQRLVVDKSFTGHASMLGSTYNWTNIEGLGREIAVITADDTNPPLDVRAYGVKVTDITFDGNGSANSCLAVGATTVDGLGYNSYESKYAFLELKNSVSQALLCQDQAYYNSFDHIRMMDGHQKWGILFDTPTGATGDNGQMSFTDCTISSPKLAVHRNAVAANYHRINFLRCGFYDGSTDTYQVDTSVMFGTTFVSCDFEGAASPPSGALVRAGASGVGFYGCQFSLRNLATNGISGDGTYGPYAVEGCQFDSVKSGQYAVTGTTLFSGLESCGFTSLGGTISGSTNNTFAPRFARAMSGTTAAIPTGAAWPNGQFEFYHDTQASAYYLIARIDGTTVKVVMT